MATVAHLQADGILQISCKIVALLLQFRYNENQWRSQKFSTAFLPTYPCSVALAGLPYQVRPTIKKHHVMI